MSMVPVVNIDSEDPVVMGLALAVLHHGMSNLAERSIPSRADTVLETAKMFERHINGEAQPALPPRNHR